MKNMSNTFMRVGDVATELGVSKSYAYKVVRKLNSELNELGYLTVAGRISKRYFMEKLCYGAKENREGKLNNGSLQRK
jgi:hypothetical protein